MTVLPIGWNFQDIYYYRCLDRPAQFYYIPGTPRPQRNEQGTPAISLMVLDELAMLQLSAQWWVDGHTLEALKVHLLQQFPELSTTTLELQLAPVTINQVVLGLKNQSGHDEILSSGTSSGQSPFSKVFSMQLLNEQRAMVIAVFKGRKEVLSLSYQGTLKVDTWATAMISGDVTTLVKLLTVSATIADCAKLIEGAIAQKILKLEHSASPEALAELGSRAEVKVKIQAAELLLQMFKGTTKLSQSQLQTTAKLTASVPVKFTRSVDVNSWFPNGNGSDYMQLMGL
jgi:hypothetical protein